MGRVPTRPTGHVERCAYSGNGMRWRSWSAPACLPRASTTKSTPGDWDRSGDVARCRSNRVVLPSASRDPSQPGLVLSDRDTGALAGGDQMARDTALDASEGRI